MTRFKLKPIAIVLAAALALLVGYAVFFANKPKAPSPVAAKPAPSAKPALTVTTTQPQRLTLPIQLSANGTVAAWQEAVVGSESHGLRLGAVLVNVGDVVKAGQVLARFADDGVQADVAQARARPSPRRPR
jgi:multidrug efflux pump subunit AcrA (membrane-fusion protein)